VRFMMSPRIRHNTARFKNCCFRATLKIAGTKPAKGFRFRFEYDRDLLHAILGMGSASPEKTPPHPYPIDPANRGCYYTFRLRG